MSAIDEDPTYAFIKQGAIIKELSIANRNIVLGFSNDQAYQIHNTPYFGETIGRVANRIQNATIKNLNGRSYQLAANNGPNSLHGGSVGWGKKMFQGPEIGLKDDKKHMVVYTLISEDGDEGYPGTVYCSVTYTTSSEVEEGQEKACLTIDYEVKLADEQPEGVGETAVNITNHSYFNIGPGETIAGTNATLRTNLHLPVDEHNIPIGTIEPYAGIRADERFTLGKDEPDIDHCFILNPHPATVPLDTRDLPLRSAALFSHADTGINLEVFTTEPAFQFYTGKYIDVGAIDGTPARGARAGFCVEPSRFINAVNVDEWRNMTVLRQGEVYGSRIAYKAWVDSDGK
ncbi:MAG: hypothetical protein M1839_007264 [Geoglossum umbratile]|nr:MAG: hypothetical protein M1839_007264 [Geoglossum umbratile]